MTGSELLDMGMDIPGLLLPDHDVLWEYRDGPDQATRKIVGNLDIGAFENSSTVHLDDESSMFGLALYPNPCQNILSIASKSDAPMTIKIINAQGLEMSKSAFLGSASLDVSQWQNGIYAIGFLQKGEWYYSRIIKN